jgi:hypothetical protein
MTTPAQPLPLEELRKLAEKALHGLRTYGQLSDDRSDYLAAVSPTTILALIDRLKAAEAEADHWKTIWSEDHNRHVQIAIERERYLIALKDIKQNEGRVCENYDTCTHTACESSYGAWVAADRALRAPSPSEAGREGAR